MEFEKAKMIALKAMQKQNHNYRTLSGLMLKDESQVWRVLNGTKHSPRWDSFIDLLSALNLEVKIITRRK